MKTSYEEQIETIMNSFDFVIVCRAMQAVDWHWHDLDHTPNVDELRQGARDLLNTIVKEDAKVMSTGGFEVTKLNNVLILKFVLEEYDFEYWDN